MTGKTDTRIREIHRRTAIKRRQRERRSLVRLSVLSLFLIAGIGAMLSDTHAGIAQVAGGYSSVLLRGEVSAYVVVAIAAFVAGAAAAVTCIRLKKNALPSTRRGNESEEPV